MKHILLSTFAVYVLFGCATGDKIKDIDVGMSRTQVIEILGKPDGVRQQGEYEALVYSNRAFSTLQWGHDRTDYTIILQNGMVTEYGPGEVRNNGPEMLILVPY